MNPLNNRMRVFITKSHAENFVLKLLSALLAERRTTSNCNRGVRVEQVVQWEGGQTINFISQSPLTTRGNCCGSLFKESDNGARLKCVLEIRANVTEPKGFWT
ncbi:hypothetical protein CDAR_299971 [Caerostris darwini]|uniref:Uncharacterized protein n=1 Tax=Caerostris darwini TaxID=1538125 RepID=A0AAV4W695_9ARAC|nr:hypothetical protein CDAR_299971 [Caerostris darwini]